MRFIKDVLWLVLFTIAFIGVLFVVMAWAMPEETKQLITCMLGGC